MEISIGLSIMNNFSFPLTIRFITLINFACLRKTHLVESYNIYIDLSVIARCSYKYPCYIFMALTRFFVVVVFVSDYRIIITKIRIMLEIQETLGSLILASQTHVANTA